MAVFNIIATILIIIALYVIIYALYNIGVILNDILEVTPWGLDQIQKRYEDAKKRIEQGAIEKQAKMDAKIAKKSVK